MERLYNVVMSDGVNADSIGTSPRNALIHVIHAKCSSFGIKIPETEIRAKVSGNKGANKISVPSSRELLCRVTDKSTGKNYSYVYTGKYIH